MAVVAVPAAAGAAVVAAAAVRAMAAGAVVGAPVAAAVGAVVTAASAGVCPWPCMTLTKCTANKKNAGKKKPDTGQRESLEI